MNSTSTALSITAHIHPAHPRPIDRCKNTGRVRIGIAHVPQPPAADSLSADALHLQRALLDPRTAHPASALQRLAAAVWRWC